MSIISQSTGTGRYRDFHRWVKRGHGLVQQVLWQSPHRLLVGWALAVRCSCEAPHNSILLAFNVVKDNNIYFPKKVWSYTIMSKLCLCCMYYPGEMALFYYETMHHPNDFFIVWFLFAFFFWGNSSSIMMDTNTSKLSPNGIVSPEAVRKAKTITH